MSGSRALLAIALAAACTDARAQTPVGELAAADASVKGAVTLTATGMRVMNGSTVTAGESAATLRLTRGGELRVCPHSSISIASSPSGSQLMLAMNSGAVEAHYPLSSSRDTFVTPDFRILLIGPGDFHVAIGADARGDTCVRTLDGNTSAIVVEEQMQEGIRQLGPKEQAIFHNGSVKNLDTVVPPECGCPVPKGELAARPRPIPRLEDDELRTSAPDARVVIDAPLVFSGEPSTPTPAPVHDGQLGEAPPTPAQPPARHKGILGHIRSWLGRVFR